MTALPAELDLGENMIGQWVWSPAAATAPKVSVPAGLVLDHGDHQLLVPWVRLPGHAEPACTLESLVPLTVGESVKCGICGAEGRIEAGAWVPMEGGRCG